MCLPPWTKRSSGISPNVAYSRILALTSSGEQLNFYQTIILYLVYSCVDCLSDLTNEEELELLNY